MQRENHFNNEVRTRVQLVCGMGRARAARLAAPPFHASPAPAPPRESHPLERAPPVRARPRRGGARRRGARRGARRRARRRSGVCAAAGRAGGGLPPPARRGRGAVRGGDGARRPARRGGGGGHCPARHRHRRAGRQGERGRAARGHGAPPGDRQGVWAARPSVRTRSTSGVAGWRVAHSSFASVTAGDGTTRSGRHQRGARTHRAAPRLATHAPRLCAPSRCAAAPQDALDSAFSAYAAGVRSELGAHLDETAVACAAAHAAAVSLHRALAGIARSER